MIKFVFLKKLAFHKVGLLPYDKSTELSDEKNLIALKTKSSGSWTKLVWNYQFVANDVSSFSYLYGIGNPIYMVDKDIGTSLTIPTAVSVVNGKVFVHYRNSVLPGNSEVFALGLK